MKKSQLKMMDTIQIRLTGPEKSKLKALAEIYAGGNLSMYILGQSFDAPRKFYADNKSPKRIKSKRL